MENVYTAEVKALRAEVARLSAGAPTVPLSLYADDVLAVIRVLEARPAHAADTPALLRLLEALAHENEELSTAAEEIRREVEREYESQIDDMCEERDYLIRELDSVRNELEELQEGVENA